MATETEIKLSLSVSAANQLAQHPLLAGLERDRQLLVSTYYDTPDRRLRGERIVVRYRQKGRLWLLAVKTAPLLAAGLAQRSEWEVPGQPGEFNFAHVDSNDVRELLEALREQLQPVFKTHFRRDLWLLERRPGVRIEVALDRGWIDAQGRRLPIREVELELLAGTVGDLFSAAIELQATLPLHPEVSSKSERGYRLVDDVPLTAVKAPPVATEAGMPTVTAFRLIALSCLNQLQSNEKGVCQSDEPEFVHQARVAIRRLRSAIRLWEPLLPESFVARFDPVWQELATKLGDTRNWEVFHAEIIPLLAESVPGVDLDRLARYALRRGASSRRASRNALRSADYSRLLIDFTAEILALPEGGTGHLASFVPRCLKKRARHVDERAAGALGSDVAARHRLRVAFKQMRYALEFFAPILAGQEFTDYHQAATCLQEMLGRLNDLVVAGQLTAEAPLGGGKGSVIQDWLSAQSEALLPEFRKLLADFQHCQVPWQAS
jgi:triphosphatase